MNATLLLLIFRAVRAQAEWPYVVPSKDGTPILYEIYGTEEPTLVFVHGWSCDARYWRAQLSHFSKNHRVVTLDLAGHGHSGTTRSKYTLEARRMELENLCKGRASLKIIWAAAQWWTSCINQLQNSSINV